MGINHSSDKPQSLLEEEPEYVVDKIRDEQLNDKGDKEYLVKWKDYPDIDCTWEPYNNLKHTQAFDRWEDTSHIAASMANATNNGEMEEEFLLNEPLTFREAISSPNSTGWQQAIREEYDSLMKNKTWELVKLPKDHKIIKCKWIFCHKLNKDGQIKQLKA